MEEIFTFKNVDYSLRNNTSLKKGHLKTVYYETESFISLDAKIRNLLPNKYKELKPFPCLNQEFQTVLQMNALVGCAKTNLQILVSSDC